MTGDVAAAIFAILRTRRSQGGYEWTDENAIRLQEEYAIVLAGKPDDFGFWLRDAIIKRFRWRPDPPDIEDLYLEFCGLGDPQAELNKLLALRDKLGPYAAMHPQHKGVYVLGPPAAVESSPVLREVIGRMGGWEEFCQTEFIPGLRKSFASTYETVKHLVRSQDLLLLESESRPALTNEQHRRR